MKNRFYRKKGNIIWEVKTDMMGSFDFTFDKKTIYNFFQDYWKLTDEQREIFDREFPYFAELKNPNVKLPVVEDDMEDEDEDEEYEYSD